MRLIWIGLAAIACLADAWGQWSDPVLMDDNMDTLGINTQTKEWCPFISADGQYFWFAREHTNNDLYVCHRVGEGWSEPLKLPFCTEIGDERNPTTNTTNDTLYFITHSGGWDIFWSFRTGPCDTCWGTPERLPQPINSTGIEFSVWCTPDNERLLFSSWRISANGEDIYECRRDSNAPAGWTDPALLPGELNTWDTESYPSMGSDTTELFFHGRGMQICRSALTDSGWTFGEPLPTNINRIIGQYPSEITPCIAADGRRLFFASRWGPDSISTAGDIWYTERPMSAPGRPEHGSSRQGLRIEVYPNPGYREVWLTAEGSLRRVTLFDLLGRRLQTWNLASDRGHNAWNLQTRSLSAGTYFLLAESRTETKSIRIQIIK